MPTDNPSPNSAVIKHRLTEAIEALTALQFGSKQRNETAAYTLLALLELQPEARWAEAQAPLCGITPIINFIAKAYGVRYAPNTRETIRDDAVKFFVEEGLLLRNPDAPTRIVQVIEVPRSLLQDFLKMPESDQVSVYFLFGEAEDGTEQKVYLGQTGDLRARLVKHNKEKEFWERALVLISRTNSLTQTHALFLEWHCLQAARRAVHRCQESRPPWLLCGV